jgi:hypothetical protein
MLVFTDKSLFEVNEMEGLWTAEFGSSVGIFGGGVVVFHEGKIMGGDNGLATVLRSSIFNEIKDT